MPHPIGRRPLVAAALLCGALWPRGPNRELAQPARSASSSPGRPAAAPISRCGWPRPAMQQVLGQPVVLENRAGASGSVGAGVVAQAAPDGYTTLADTAGGSVNHLLIPGLPYDFAKQLTPISQMVRSPLVCVVRADHPSRDLPALIERLRAAPGQIPYASSGVGTATHLAPALLLRRAGVSANHVSYRGGAASIAGILAGDAGIRLLHPALGDAADPGGPAARPGRQHRPSPAQPARHPDRAGTGLPDFDVADWLGFYAPTGTPAPIIARLAEAAQAGMRDPNAVKRLGEIGMIPVGSSPAEFTAFFNDQRARMGALILAEGIKVE